MIFMQTQDLSYKLAKGKNMPADTNLLSTLYTHLRWKDLSRGEKNIKCYKLYFEAKLFILLQVRVSITWLVSTWWEHWPKIDIFGRALSKN